MRQFLYQEPLKFLKEIHALKRRNVLVMQHRNGENELAASFSVRFFGCFVLVFSSFPSSPCSLSVSPFSQSPIPSAQRKRFFSSVKSIACISFEPQVEALSSPKDEAKRALCYYLYGTRAIDFTLARHIAYNSPHFLKKLLSASGSLSRSPADTRASVARYLRMIPIDEFEPFFESIGIRPSKIEEILPEGQMFLTRNQSFLKNVYTLCGIGVPMDRLGKLYVNAKSIFYLPSGVLNDRIKSYENLGLNMALLSLIFSCCPQFLASAVVDPRLDSLIKTLAELGFEDLDICRVLEGCFKKDPGFWQNVNEKLSVLRIFVTLGCKKENFGTLLMENFHTVCSCASEILEFRLSYLSRLGFSSQDICYVILSNPSVLIRGNDRPLVRNVYLMKTLSLDKEAMIQIVKLSPQILGPDVADIPVTVLRKFGVSQEKIEDFKDSRERLIALSDIGLDACSSRTLEIVWNTRGSGLILKEKLNILREYGIPHSRMLKLIRLHSAVLHLSPDSLRARMEYISTRRDTDFRRMKTYPRFLVLDFENIIKPRCRFWEWLKEKNLIRKEHRIHKFLECSDSTLSKSYLRLHSDAADVYRQLKYRRQS